MSYYYSPKKESHLPQQRYENRLIFVIPAGFLLVIFSLLLSSCKKFVEVGPPVTQLASSSVFTSDATATAALTSIYGQMMNSGGFASGGPFSVTSLSGLSADELINYSTIVSQIEFYQNSLSINNSAVQANLWTECYQYIYMANAVIEGLNNSTAVSTATKQQLTGEAKFIRAFCHFYLVNLFGDIPSITATNYQANSSVSRTAKAQVYQQIIADLKDAQNLLNDGYVKADNTVYPIASAERIRPNKWAATALLARAYLYTQDWVNAESQATAIINNTNTYGLILNLNQVFLKNSMEAIWQLMPVTTNIITLEAQYFILTGSPSSGTINSKSLSTQLVNAFEPGDARKANWVNSILTGGQTYYYAYKYKVLTSSTPLEYSMVLRLAEQYLIRAEARTQQNNISGAQADLNSVRSRATLGPTTANDKTSLLLAIEHEVQVELFTEWGHRWLNIKRTNRSDAVFGADKQGWKTTAALYPIPQIQIQNDPNITQNQGY